MDRCAVAILLAGSILWTAGPAAAACHIAAFTDTDVRVDEDAGKAELTVELVGGQPTCSGSVHYRTEDGTAKAPRDYEAREGELTFSPGDDRVETIRIPIVDDGRDEQDERFTVVLSAGSQPGNIQPDGGPATVTIRDDDEPAAPEPAEETPAGETRAPAEEESEETAGPSPRRTRTPKRSPSPQPTIPEATTSPAPLAVPDDGGSNAGLIIAIAAVLVVAAGGVFALTRRRRA